MFLIIIQNKQCFRVLIVVRGSGRQYATCRRSLSKTIFMDLRLIWRISYLDLIVDHILYSSSVSQTPPSPSSPLVGVLIDCLDDPDL